MQAYKESSKFWLDKTFSFKKTVFSKKSRHLRELIKYGVCTAPNKVPSDIIDKTFADLDRYQTEKEQLIYHKEGLGIFSSHDTNTLALSNGIFGVHDLHYKSINAANLMTEKAFASILRQAFDGTPFLMQSQIFKYATAKGCHADYVYLPFDHPTHSLTCWIAGEDIAEESGPLYYYPCSHSLPFHELPNKGHLYTYPENDLISRVRYHEELEKVCQSHDLQKKKFIAKKGEVLIFHSKLVHGSLAPKKRENTRNSFSLHFSSVKSFTNKGTPLFCSDRLKNNNGIAYQNWREYQANG